MQDKNHVDVKKILLALASHLEAKGIRGLASKLGENEGKLYAWINRGVIADTGSILSRCPEVRKEWLETGEGEMLRPPVSFPHGIEKFRRFPKQRVEQGKSAGGEPIHVPVYTAAASAGPGAINGEGDVQEYFSFDRAFARVTFGATSNLACLRATGDSMLPTIAQGDMLVIDLSDTSLQKDAVPYILQIGETTVVKRIHRLSRTAIRIASDNPTGWTRELQLNELEPEGIEIKGRVVAIMKLA